MRPEEEMRVGDRLSLRTVAGVALGSIEVLEVVPPHEVLAGCRVGPVAWGKIRLEASTGTAQERMLAELAAAADELALGVMDQAELELERQGLQICGDRGGCLTLGRDFRGIVIANAASFIRFELVRESHD